MTKFFHKQYVSLISTTALLLHSAVAIAAPGDVLFSDAFDRANLAPWATTDAAASGILTGGQTSGSNPRAAYTRNNAVTVTSPAINAAVPAANLDIWVRRGSDSLNNSGGPDANEDFVIEYQTAGGTWNPVITYLGSGTDGQIYNASFILPAAALHAALSVRVSQTQGSGVDFDYWHFDDVVVTETALAGPLDVGVCDFFENGLGANWTINATSGLAGISAATSLSPSNSLFLNGGVVDVTSVAVDTTDVTFSDITLWVRRGSRAFSDDPDGGENLVVEYLNDSSVWVGLETFTGSGGPGQQFTRTYNIPGSGRHANFQLRIRMTAGSGPTSDFWHVDDVCFAQSADPILQVSKVATLISDPVSGTANPHAIPGAIAQYTVSVTNQGIGTVDGGTVEITDPLPANTALFVSTLSGDPVAFVDGNPVSGLSFNFATDVEYSNQLGGGVPYDYTPMPDTDGFDTAVTGIRITPGGPMNAATAGGDPNFQIVFRIRVE